MKLLDLFKRKERKKRLEKPAQSPKEVLAPENSASSETKNLGNSKNAPIVLQKPRVTEKSSKMSEAGVYVFKVYGSSSKPEVKRAVEELYKVKVAKVNVANMPSRLRRVGRKIGRRPGYKKAAVKLAEGHKIEFV